MERDWTGELHEEAWLEALTCSEAVGAHLRGADDAEVPAEQVMEWDREQAWHRVPTSMLPVIINGLRRLR